jgi:hypothetical protein
MRAGLLIGLAGFVLAVGWPILITLPAFGIFTLSCLRALWPQPAVEQTVEQEAGSIAAARSPA